MIRSFRPIPVIILTLIFLLLGVGFDRFKLQFQSEERVTERFQRTLNRKQLSLSEILDEMSRDIESNDQDYDFLNNAGRKRYLENQGFEIFFFSHDTLKYWSDKNIQVENLIPKLKLKGGVIFLGSAWYVYQNRELESGRYLSGLILLKHEFAYENDFLQNKFHKHFRISSCIGISAIPVEGAREIMSNDEDFLCSLFFPDDCKSTGHPVAAFFYSLCLLSFLFFLRALIKSLRNKYPVNWVMFFVLLVVLGLNFLIFYFKIPSDFFELDLFSPFHFAISDACSSLGHLLIHSVFIFFVFYNFYQDFRFKKFLISKSNSMRRLVSLLGFLFAAVFFSLIVYLFQNLLKDSNILFEPYKILKISYLSLTGFLTIVLLFISFGLYLYKLINTLKPHLERKDLMLTWMGSIVFFILFQFLLSSKIDFYSLALYILLGYVIYQLSPGFSYAALVFFAILFGIYSTLIIVLNSELKAKKNRELLAVNLSVERDPVAELMFRSIARKLNYDEGLRNSMSVDDFSDQAAEKIFDHLRKNLFNSYWENYDLYVTLCNANSNLIVENEIEESCFLFFEGLVEEFGTPLETDGFSLLNLGTSNTSYFGSFFFERKNDSLLNGLFLELSSRPVLRQLGYPELLLDKSQTRLSAKDDYSYAKYENGKLVIQSGEYKYNLSEKFVQVEGADYINYNADGFDHLAYFVSSDLVVVVSQQEIKLSNLLISFSYLFVFLFLISNLIFLLASLPLRIHRKSSLLKYKIQLWMISILFFSLIFIGLATIFFSIRQYRTKQFEVLSEKIQSVYVEIDHKLGFEPELTRDWYTDQYGSLDELLIKFSNVFFSDINLYDPEGNILATSRPEVLTRGLTSRKMDYHAFRELVVNNKAEFVQEESIGDLNYLSAYVPFINHDNQLLAYLNLPYFTRQNSLKTEISNLVVAIINFSMVMILISLILAVVISNQITTPLRLIQQKIGELKLGRKSEPIYYQGKDEIGSLVNEYNRMIDELARNVEALAKSERESAWREMARQIAHEIKNPLTPMKLSIQQLQKSWEDNVPDWGVQLRKISKTLIEQIDNLSSIASAFSNFAEMPQARNSAVDMIALINNLVILFSNNDNLKFNVDLRNHTNVYVFADDKQLGRVFTNLIKNAIQSVPPERNPEINLELIIKEKRVFISLEDNGEGVPEDMGEKLFEPNFTTKSSGMGLGLAIARKIINDTGGTISYQTNIGKGTRFTIDLPEYEG
ncbi:MAG: ATP-binding protein [Bacteroidota bacterium]|nr:ATP-binding protein [Bacteroidota bacterium]